MSASTSPTTRRDELEKIIEQGLATFIEVGNALLEIRDSHLYQQDFKTFEHYCRERWQMSRIHAHRLIEAAEVTANLLPTGNTPAHERQVRPLTKLEPEQQHEAWNKAVKNAPNGKPTAKDVEAAVDQLKAPAKSDDPAKTIKKLTKALVKEFAEILHRHGLGCVITFSSTEGKVDEVIETECGWRETAIVDRGKITVRFHRKRNARSERINQETAK